MGILCIEILERNPSGSIKKYGGTYELDLEDATAGVKEGKYRIIGLSDKVLPDGTIDKEYMKPKEERKPKAERKPKEEVVLPEEATEPAGAAVEGVEEDGTN